MKKIKELNEMKNVVKVGKVTMMVLVFELIDEMWKNKQNIL